MANSPRDVALTVSVETVGTDGIKNLQQSLQELAKEGGSAAPEFKALADEIQRLGDQSKLTASVRQLSSDIESVGAAEAKAAEDAKVLRQELSSLSDVTKLFEAVESSSKTKLDEAKRAVFEKGVELKTLRNETDEAGKKSSEYKVAVQNLNDEIIKGNVAVRDLADSYAKAKQDAKEAETAEKALADQYQRASREAEQLKNELTTKNQLLRESKSSLEALGAATENVAAAESDLLKSYGDLSNAIASATEARKKANAEALAAAAAEKQAVEEKIAAEKEYEQKIGVINAQITNAQKAANDKRLADEKATNDARIADEKRVADAANAVSESLKTVGVRSAAEIRSEIEKVKNSLELLKTTGTLTGVELDNAFKKGTQEINALERELRGVNDQLTISDRLANLFKSSMGQFAAGNIIANGVMLAAEKVAELGRAFITTMIQGEQLSKGMNAIYGDSKLAASQIQFLRKASIETGVSFSEVTTEFVKFSASMNSANIPLEQSNALFKAVTAASSALGLGTEATAGALNALGQMASKGVVSMEELRQQLGDRLPGVMGLTAKAMGITEGELVKLVESGTLATRDFIVPFTKGMESLKGETDGVVPTFNKFKSALAGIAQDIGAAGGLALMTTTIKALGGVVFSVTYALSVLSEVVFGLAKSLGIVTGALVTFTNPMGELKNMLKDSTDRLSKQGDTLTELAWGYDKATEAAKANGAAIAATVEETRKAEQVVKDHANAQNLSKVAFDLVSNASLVAAGNMVKFQAEVDNALAKQEQQSSGLKLHVEAMKEEGKSLITLAKLTNDTAKEREAEAKASELEATALEKLQASYKAEVDLLVIKRTQILKDAEAKGLSADATKAQIDAIDKKLVSAQAELEETQKKTIAITAEATARRLASDALKDNSKNIDEYRDALKGAKANLDEIIEQEKEGILTKQDVKVAQDALVRATFLYNDAVNDSIKAIELENKANQAAIQIASARASVGVGHYESLAKEARAVNDTALATYYDIEAKKQSIKVLELKMEMERLQNAAALAEIEMKRKLVDASTDEGQAKLKVLDIEAQLIQVKNVSNEGIKDQIRNIEAEIKAQREGNVTKHASAAANHADSNARLTNTGVIDNQTSALERQNAAIERQNAAIEKAAELERKRNGVDKEGFVTNKDGQRLVAGSELGSKTGIYNFLKSAGVDNEAVARKLATDFTGGADLTPYDLGGTSGWRQYGSARSGDSLSTALLKAAQDYTFGTEARKANMRWEAGDTSLNKQVQQTTQTKQTTQTSLSTNSDQFNYLYANGTPLSAAEIAKQRAMTPEENSRLDKLEQDGEQQRIASLLSQMAALQGKDANAIAPTDLNLKLLELLKANGGNIPKFASGGYHSGGIRLVGENGPELEVTGSSNIYNAEQTKEILERPEKLRKELEEIYSKINTFENLARAGQDERFYQMNGFSGGRVQLGQELSQLKARTQFKKDEIEAAEIQRNELKRQKARAIADDMESWGNRATIASVLNSDAAKREGLDFGSVRAAMEGYNSKAFAHEIKTIAGQIAPNGSGKTVSFADIENYYKKEKNSVLSSSEAAMARQALSDLNAPTPVASSTTQAANAPSNNAGTGKQYAVNITINNQTASINTASDSDAQSLVGLLKSLETASKRTI